MNQQFQYYAFISYKHEQSGDGKFAADEKWAHVFKRYLESWRIPTHVPVGERLNEDDLLISPVFRDSEDYPTSHDLNQLTYKFLSESKTLIVILSREMLEDQLRLRYEEGSEAWIFNEIEYFVELGNSLESIINFYVGEDEIDPNMMIKEKIDWCESRGVECKALNYLYQPGKIVKRLRDFKDKGKEINQYATAVIAAGIFNSDPRFFINAYELAERKRTVLAEHSFRTEDGYVYEIVDEESVFLTSVPYVKDVIIPRFVEYKGFEFDVIGLGEGPFYGTDLSSVFIPKSVTHILCETLFGHQDVIESVIVEEGNPRYDSRGNCNAIIDTASNTLLCGCRATVIPDSVTRIADSAFERCTTLEVIEIPDSVQAIGAKAFCRCLGLRTINIPEGVEVIRENTFNGCKSLREVSIPQSVTIVEALAFCGCSGMDSIILHDRIRRIEERAFVGCRSLEEICYNGNIEQWNSIDFDPWWKEDEAEVIVRCLDGVVER